MTGLESRRFAWAAGVVLVTAAVVIATGRRRRARPAPSLDRETARVRELYDRVATKYDRGVQIPERLLFGEGRIWAASQAKGDVLEVAVGTGRNLPYYPPEVRLAAIDVSPAMVEIAGTRAQKLGRDVNLHVGDAQKLPFASGAFDSIVCTLSLCTIPDDRLALVESCRVLRSGGRLILLEHVRSPQPALRMLQRLLEPLAVHYAGDHLLRDPLDHLHDVGFLVEFCERSRAGLVERVVARKAAESLRQTST